MNAAIGAATQGDRIVANKNLTVNLNKNASALMGDATKVRIRATAGKLEIRPTNRVSGKTLPKGEVLVDLRSKKQAVRALRFTMPKEIASAVLASASDCFQIRTAKHGWLVLAGCDKPVLVPGQAQNAGGSVSDK